MTRRRLTNAGTDKRWVRWSLLTVPTILLMGMLSGGLAGSGYGNPWFDLLRKPAIMPPAWVFPSAWSTLYVLMGIAVALVLGTRGGKKRSIAITLFLIQLALNLTWSPIFFAQHRIMLAFGIILAILFWAAMTTILFWRIRRVAGWLMLPYLAWLMFAGILNWQIHRLNPYGISLVPAGGNTQIIVQ